jgi:short subunit dehydrogenase-like uncharacterized protein
MTPRVILLGATGYTGRLAAASLIEIGERPLLAGRSPSRLSSLADSLGGLDTAVADVSHPESVKDIVSEGDVLVSTVGPFTLYGNVALDAALGAGAHYVDSTGEPAFIRKVFSDGGPAAQKLGVTLLTSFGVDWVPGNVAGAIAASNAGPDARRLDIGYLIQPIGKSGDASTSKSGSTAAGATGASGGGKRRGPVISTGTRASIIAASAAPQHARRHGSLVLEPASRHARSFTVNGVTKWGTSVGGSEPLSLTRLYPGLAEIGVYLSFPGPVRLAQGVALGFSLALGALEHVPPGRRAIEGMVRAAAKKTGGGPSPESRALVGTQVVAVCRDAAGRPICGVILEGDVDGYTLSGRTLAWGAASLLAGRQLASGALGPVEAFGLDECVSALARAGLTAADLDKSELLD